MRFSGESKYLEYPFYTAIFRRSNNIFMQSEGKRNMELALEYGHKMVASIFYPSTTIVDAKGKKLYSTRSGILDVE